MCQNIGTQDMTHNTITTLDLYETDFTHHGHIYWHDSVLLNGHCSVTNLFFGSTIYICLGM